MHSHVGQGEGSAAYTAGVMRQLGARDPEAMALIAQGLGVWSDGDAIDSAPEKAAAEIERVLASVNMPARISQLDIPRESLPLIVQNSLKNFNADPKQEFAREREKLLQVIESCW
jgi:alcohol dehydrogenase class IV